MSFRAVLLSFLLLSLSVSRGAVITGVSQGFYLCFTLLLNSLSIYNQFQRVDFTLDYLKSSLSLLWF